MQNTDDKLNKYDLIVLGFGKGGKTLAMKLGREGKRVLVIEKSRAMFGGSCINVACIPTKAFITAAHALTTCKRASSFGITGVESAAADWPAVQKRVFALVETLRAANQKNLESTPNLELVVGEGKFSGAKSIDITLEDGTTRTVTAESIVINTGTRSFMPDTPGLKEIALNSDSIQHVEKLPEHLIVMGAGYIGLEFAQLFATLGSKVTVINRGGQIIPREDADVAAALTERFEKQGIEILNNTNVLAVDKSEDGVGVTLKLSGASKVSISGSHLLVALGRIPNTEALALGTSGVFVDKRAFIKVDERLMTSCEGIYAIGDVNGGPQFTHISFDDYRVVKDQIIGAGLRVTTDRQVPSTLFTDPEIARVGITEKEAIEQSLDVEVVKVPVAVVPRAKVAAETDGFMKAIIDRGTGLILGATFVGIEAGNMLAVVQMAMLGNLTFSQVRDAIYSHPTMPEGLIDLFSAVKLADL